jgi:ornithine cyclodeaminase
MTTYINQNDIDTLDLPWSEYISVISQAITCLPKADYVQPVKPYLRYKNPTNRIIAMPAYIGGDFDTAGIKWIASFPDNINKGIPRAHSVVLLNDAATGQPKAIINTPQLSVIRTSAVTGVMIKEFVKARNLSNLKVGIIGWGPIGQNHYKMCAELLAGKVDEIKLYDLRPINLAKADTSSCKTTVVDSWQEAYRDADIFMTCTVSKAPYIDLPPKAGSLHLNVSLRDYKSSMCNHFKGAIIVDDWEEICREKTDIEMMHLHEGLQEKDVDTIARVIEDRILDNIKADQPVMFNPMGMAIFDVALGTYIHQKMAKRGIGLELV